MTECIEERLRQTQWAGSLASSLNPMSDRFLTDLLPRFVFPETTRQVLEGYSNLDFKAEDFARILARNSYYEYQFRFFVESLGKREHVPSVVATVVLLGMQRSRDLVLALQMFRTITGQHIPWTPGEKLGLLPADFLSYTAKIEDPLIGRREPWATTAYLAGVLFDWAAQVATLVQPNSKTLRPFLDSIFNHGSRTAKVMVALAPLVPELSSTRFTYCAGLVHDLGKFGMALLDPTYPEFHADLMARGLPRGLRQYVEKLRFGLTHEVIGAAICEATGIFKPIARSILFHHEPFLAKRESKSLGAFSGLLALSSNIAHHFQKPERAESLILSAWKSPELREFSIDMKKAELLILKLIEGGA